MSWPTVYCDAAVEKYVVKQKQKTKNKKQKTKNKKQKTKNRIFRVLMSRTSNERYLTSECQANILGTMHYIHTVFHNF